MITTQRLDLVKVPTKQGLGGGAFTKRDHTECGEMTNGCW